MGEGLKADHEIGDNQDDQNQELLHGNPPLSILYHFQKINQSTFSNHTPCRSCGRHLPLRRDAPEECTRSPPPYRPFCTRSTSKSSKRPLSSHQKIIKRTLPEVSSLCFRDCESTRRNVSRRSDRVFRLDVGSDFPDLVLKMSCSRMPYRHRSLECSFESFGFISSPDPWW